MGTEQYRDLITRALMARVRRADDALEAAEEPHHIARVKTMGSPGKFLRRLSARAIEHGLPAIPEKLPE